ncbi:uncharacterized protein BDR25DRAFT_319451 [Lindgomyces ingoldianus]|uniref:Uncharacterized protein n=1 Tax=Lindgomyces ingoldianus TaxID=673940 RepID=A0ACB6QAT8_9PLEO|nr:uncharacterized protein BDR25DRAFT_319451 [Lindgomyces ingoldianus]KAF2464026.1 hypothetical protein BDR25DRAFT_319451 [Lindgomyces ingoldianus]
MTWFINKGDDLERDRAITHPFYRTFDLDMDDDDYIIYTELMMCASDRAPKYPGKSVQRNSKLRVDLSDIPKDQFKKVSGRDGPHLKLNYKLLVKVEGARLVFAFECAGKEYASVEADFGA